VKGMADVLAASSDRDLVVQKARALARELECPIAIDWYPGGKVRKQCWVAWLWVPENFPALPYPDPERGYLNQKNLFVVDVTRLWPRAPSAFVE